MTTDSVGSNVIKQGGIVDASMGRLRGAGALRAAIAEAGVPAKTLLERVWTIIKDSGPIQTSAVASSAGISLRQARQTIANLARRNMAERVGTRAFGGEATYRALGDTYDDARATMAFRICGHCGQSKHAAALADQKTPAVNDNAGRWYVIANDGMATLCASEADALAEAADADAAWPRKAPHRAVQLVPAHQLAAAVAAERGKCAGIVNELRMECARRNMPESATMLWHAEDAIRAGAPPDTLREAGAVAGGAA